VIWNHRWAWFAGCGAVAVCPVAVLERATLESPAKRHVGRITGAGGPLGLLVFFGLLRPVAAALETWEKTRLALR